MDARRSVRLPILSLGLFVLTAMPALAHHPLAGARMTTFVHGALSGIGHPLLGFDHLFFVAAVGIAASLVGRALLAPLAYIATMLAGVLIAAAGVVIPATELAIVVSLILLGVLVMRGRGLSAGVVLGIFAIAGLFHGAAFGASIAGQEGGAPVQVLWGYLIGLGLVQWAIAVAAGFALTRGIAAARASDLPARLAGAAVAGIGAFLLLEQAEGAAFAALGLG